MEAPGLVPCGSGPQGQRELAAKYTREGEVHANGGWFIVKQLDRALLNVQNGIALRAGQQRLPAAEERLAPAASAARAEKTQKGRASLASVGVAQESRDEEMTEACVTNNAENVKPWIEVNDSIEMISRMEDG